MENNEKQALISFAAIDPYVETHIVSPKETLLTGKNMVEWGERNIYPEYLLELSKQVPTLRSIIGGSVDFIAGDGCTIEALDPTDTERVPGTMNTRGDNIAEQVRCLARDFLTYGGFALQVVRSLSGKIVDLYYIDFRFLRSNKENSVFYYSEKWSQNRRNVVEYPAFYPYQPEDWARLSDEERSRNVSSILYVKNEHTQTYPFPVYGAAVKACEIERCIDDFHLNEINNGFVSSMIVNFNNGNPGDEIRKEIERRFNEKFSGHQNAGRIMFSWNDSKDVATTLEYPKVENFGDRYNSLAKHSRQQIFTAFRATPVLFGIPTDNNGFAADDYENAFRLYNRTCVRPVQRLICDAYDRIYGRAGVLTITPFSLEETATETKVN